MPTLGDLLAMVVRTIQDPRAGAREVLGMGVPREALWPMVLLVVVLSVLMGNVTALLLGAGQGIGMGGMLVNPVGFGVIQLGVMLLMIGGVYWVGRAMGGIGSLADAALLMCWLQFIMLVVQVAQTLALILVPPLGGLVGIAAMILLFWLMTMFVAELHGFASPWRVFGMILVTGAVFAFVLSLVLTAFGVGVPAPGGT